jgi:thiamine biosynthesis lipoprotein
VLASVTVVHRSLTQADIDATAAFALGADGLAWMQSRTGLVVLADGTCQVFGDSTRSMTSTTIPRGMGRWATK